MRNVHFSLLFSVGLLITCGPAPAPADGANRLATALSECDDGLTRPAEAGHELEIAVARSAVATAQRAVDADPLKENGPASRAATGYAVAQAAQVAGAGYLTFEGRSIIARACASLYPIMRGNVLNSCYVISPPPG